MLRNRVCLRVWSTSLFLFTKQTVLPNTLIEWHAPMTRTFHLYIVSSTLDILLGSTLQLQWRTTSESLTDWAKGLRVCVCDTWHSSSWGDMWWSVDMIWYSDMMRFVARGHFMCKVSLINSSSPSMGSVFKGTGLLSPLKVAFRIVSRRSISFTSLLMCALFRLGCHCLATSSRDTRSQSQPASERS